MRRIAPAGNVNTALRAANDFAWMEDSPFILPTHLLIGAFDTIVHDRAHFGSMPAFHRYPEIRTEMINSLEHCEMPDFRPTKQNGGRMRDIVQSAILKATRRGSSLYFLEDLIFATLAFEIESVDKLLRNARIDSNLRERLWVYCGGFTAPQCKKTNFARRPQHLRRIPSMQ